MLHVHDSAVGSPDTWCPLIFSNPLQKNCIASFGELILYFQAVIMCNFKSRSGRELWDATSCDRQSYEFFSLLMLLRNIPTPMILGCMILYKFVGQICKLISVDVCFKLEGYGIISLSSRNHGFPAFPSNSSTQIIPIIHKDKFESIADFLIALIPASEG